MWQLRQLEKLLELAPDLVAAALEELLQSHKVLCEKMVIGAYLGGVKALATDEALGVFAKGIDQGILPATSLKWLKRVKLRGAKERALFRQLRLRLGEGEASSLTIAVNRGYSFLTDDMKARSVAQTAGVPVSGSVGVLLELIRTRKLTLEEGNKGLRTFIQHGYFSPVERLDEIFQ